MNGKRASCSGLGINFFPTLGNEDDTVEQMNFRGNRIEYLRSIELSKCPSLNFLDVRRQRSGRCVKVNRDIKLDILGGCTIPIIISSILPPLIESTMITPTSTESPDITHATSSILTTLIKTTMPESTT
jgi:hypothetical protein